MSSTSQPSARPLPLAVLAALLLLAAGPARAATHRLLLAVGANVGEPDDPVLSYADDDAQRVRQVLAPAIGIVRQHDVGADGGPVGELDAAGDTGFDQDALDPTIGFDRRATGQCRRGIARRGIIVGQRAANRSPIAR